MYKCARHAETTRADVDWQGCKGTLLDSQKAVVPNNSRGKIYYRLLIKLVLAHGSCSR